MTEEAIINTTAAPTRKAGAPQAWVLILAMFLPILAIIGLAPALPTLMDHFKDVPNAQTLVPLLLTTPALCIAVFGGAAGWLTDRYGRRKLMLGAMLLYGASGLAPFVFQSYPAVLASRILLGVAEAFVMAIGNALLADYYTRDEQHKWLTAQGVVGPILGTLLLVSSGQLAAWGWQWPFLLYASAFPILLFGYFFFQIPFHAPSHPFHAQIMHLDISPLPLDGGAAREAQHVVGTGWSCRKEIRFEDCVTFSETETDWLGMPKMRIHYELTAADHAAIAEAMREQMRATAALGKPVFSDEPLLAPPGTSLHYQGTIRMGERDDGESVCDSYSRVWGFSNLYVGGNGVIPTATVCNPTLTSVALAARACEAIIKNIV